MKTLKFRREKDTFRVLFVTDDRVSKKRKVYPSEEFSYLQNRLYLAEK